MWHVLEENLLSDCLRRSVANQKNLSSVLTVDPPFYARMHSTQLDYAKLLYRFWTLRQVNSSYRCITLVKNVLLLCRWLSKAVTREKLICKNAVLIGFQIWRLFTERMFTECMIKLIAVVFLPASVVVHGTACHGWIGVAFFVFPVRVCNRPTIRPVPLVTFILTKVNGRLQDHHYVDAYLSSKR